MPNATITLVSENTVQKGWEFIDNQGKKWWVAPEQKDSKESNAPVAEFIRTNLNKPAEYATWEKPDGTVRMIFGKAEEGKSGAKAAWRNTKEGALAEQSNMNRRTALMQAVELIQLLPSFEAWTEWADDFYRWLQAPFVGAAGGVGTPLSSSTEHVAPRTRTAALTPVPPEAGEGQPSEASDPSSAGAMHPQEGSDTVPSDEYGEGSTGGATEKVGEGPGGPDPTDSYDALVKLQARWLEKCGGSPVKALKAAREAFGVSTLADLSASELKALIEEAA